MPALPTIAGIPILHLALMTIAILLMLGVAVALGFFIARRYYKQDGTQRVTLYQRELVRQKRRTSDGNSQSTLLRRERDRARRHVQRTVRLRQAAQARAEGGPTRRAYAPVNILRPMSLKKQELSGSVYEAEGTMARVRDGARSLVGALSFRSKVTDKVDELFDELDMPAEVAAAPAREPSRPHEEIRGEPAVRTARSALAARLTQTPAPNAAPPAPQLEPRFEPEPAPASEPVRSAMNGADGGDRTEHGVAGAIAYQQPQAEMAEVAVAPPVQSPRMMAPAAPAAAPVAAPAPGARASSSDLKRRLAQVRERSAAQRAQLEELRKTS